MRILAKVGGAQLGDAAARAAFASAVATARAAGMQIVTRDRAILSYAQQGHAWALEC